MFCDLNVPAPTNTVQKETFEDTIIKLAEVGYKTIAVSKSFENIIFEKKDKKAKAKKSNMDEEKDIITPPYDISEIKSKLNKVKFLSRLNVEISDKSQLQRLFLSKNVRKYDLVSIKPEDIEILRAVVSYPGINIISYNPENRSGIFIPRKLYNQLTSLGIYFELMYAPAILDKSCRRNTIMLSHSYHITGKSKHIIVSSGAQNKLQVRRPYDVMNLNLLFGLSEEQARSAIAYNSLKCIQEASKHHKKKVVVTMIQVRSDFPKETIDDDNKSVSE